MPGGGMPEALADRLVDLERLFREDGAREVTDAVFRITARQPRRFADYPGEIASELAR